MRADHGGRIVAPDIARGLMLLLIAVANVSIYLWGHSFDAMSAHPIDGTPLDRALGAVATALVDARIYPMFAFLFGYGMVQFLESRWRRGMDRQTISRMLLRRHLWLIAFGAVHALLLFEGDILGAYGLTGLILAPLFLWSTERAMRVTAYVLGGVVVGVAALVAAGMFALDPILNQGELGLGSSDASASVDDFTTAGIANPLLAALARFGVWILATPVSVMTLIVPLCVLLGMLAARYRWLEGGAARISLRAAAWWGIGIAVISGVPAGLISAGVFEVGATASFGFSLLSQVAGILGGVGYVALFALIAGKLAAPLRGVWLAIAAVGRRSLSFYLLQSVILAPLLANWGLGLGAQINTTGAFAIAAGVWVLSVCTAYALELRGARGPAEVLLRRLTYGRFDVLQPGGIR